MVFFLSLSFSEHIGYLLTIWRKFMGLTQQEMARKIGLRQTHICHIESGDSDIRISTLERIVYGLGLSLEEFWQGPYNRSDLLVDYGFCADYEWVGK